MWTSFLTNRWAQYALGGVLVFGLLWGAAQHFVNVGKEQQKQDSAQKFSEQIEQMRSEDRAKTDAILKGYDDRLKTLDAQKQASDAVSLRMASTLAQIGVQRAAGSQMVSSLAPDALEAFVKQKLGHADLKSELTTNDYKQIASCMVDHPLCQQENETLRGLVQQKSSDVTNREETIKTWQGKYVNLNGYTDRLEGYYAESWNLIPHKRRGLKCFTSLWIQKCVDVKLTIPHPDLLKH